MARPKANSLKVASSSPARSSGMLVIITNVFGITLIPHLGVKRTSAESASSMPKRGRPRKSIEIKEETYDDTSDSADMMLGLDGNESDGPPLAPDQANLPRRVLKAVSIPTAVPAVRSKPQKRKGPSPSPSTVGSSRSTGRGQSSGYDTPLTSAVATPAESIMKGQTSIRRRGRPANAIIPSQGQSVGKRKRVDVDDLEADAALAQVLQAEEYGGVPAKKITDSRNSRRVIQDSDEDESMLSEISEIEAVKDLAPPNKKVKPNKRTFSPAARARKAARDSLTEGARLVIEDTEDDSESEFSLPESGDDDLADEDVPSTASATPAPELSGTAVSASTTVGATRRRRRRHGPTAAGRQLWNERRIAGLEGRVSSYRPAYVTLLTFSRR